MSKQEENLKKLCRTSILMNFIKKTNADWNHQDWEALCQKVTEKYSPIDLDQVGLALEKKREDFLSKQS